MTRERESEGGMERGRKYRRRMRERGREKGWEESERGDGEGEGWRGEERNILWERERGKEMKKVKARSGEKVQQESEREGKRVQGHFCDTNSAEGNR